MAEKIFVTRAQLDAVAAGLSKLKKKEDERFTLKGGIAQISALITETLAKGFEYPDIAAILKNDHNIEIKPATLASYHRTAIKSNVGDLNASGSGQASKATARPRNTSTPASAATPPLDKPSTDGGKFTPDPQL